MKIYLASDHAGFNLKEEIKQYLIAKSYEVEDCGDFTPNPDDDYPLFIAKAAEKVSQNSEAFGFVFGKSGAGEEIVANKFKNVRAVIGFSEENVRLSRQHNNANMLSFGSDFTNLEAVKKMTDIFLNTEFSNEERHKRRLNEIKKLEE